MHLARRREHPGMISVDHAAGRRRVRPRSASGVAFARSRRPSPSAVCGGRRRAPRSRAGSGSPPMPTRFGFRGRSSLPGMFATSASGSSSPGFAMNREHAMVLDVARKALPVRIIDERPVRPAVGRWPRRSRAFDASAPRCHPLFGRPSATISPCRCQPIRASQVCATATGRGPLWSADRGGRQPANQGAEEHGSISAPVWPCRRKFSST